MDVPCFNWQDITSEFEDAVSELALGEIYHDSSFGLFAAMSAIEMMDPKMDAGMLCNQTQRKVYSLEQAVDAGLLKLSQLTSPEIIGIMDSTLATLVTWLKGHSLAQTVFTNLYLHKPDIIEDKCLKAFSVVMLKIVDIISERIGKAGCFEEEDFQPNLHGFKLAHDISETQASGMLKEVDEELSRFLRSTGQRGSAESSDSDDEYLLAVAVHTRVRFYRQLYALLLIFNKDTVDDLPQAQKLITQLQVLVPLIRSSLHLGIQQQQLEGVHATIMGFEPLINQRLLPPTFPRYAAIDGRPESLDYITGLLRRMLTITTISELDSLHAIMEVFAQFSKCLPCILARSVLQLVLLPPNLRLFGTLPVVDVLKETIRGFIAPPVLSPKCSLYNNPQARDCVDTLLAHAVRPICTLFQIAGHNRARQRDKWAHMLPELSNLQEEANKVDAALHCMLTRTEPDRSHLACLGTWVLFHTLHTMIRYVLTGFELELYAAHEYRYVYWYLSDMLLAWLVSTLHHADNFLLEQETLSDQQKGRRHKKNKRRKRPNSLSQQITFAQAQQQMFGAYLKALMGLELDGKMTKPDFEFSGEGVRFDRRFRPFTAVSTPPIILYYKYKEMSSLTHSDHQATPEDLYRLACCGFHQAKCLLESLVTPTDEVQALLMVNKTNFVVMKLLAGGHKKDSTDPPDFDFTHHPVYPMLKIS